MTPRLAVDLFAFAVAISAVIFTVYTYNFNKSNHPIEIISYDMPDYFLRGEENPFTINFYKTRDDCTNPTIRRTIVHVSSGALISTTDKIREVVQYPVKTFGEAHKVEIVTTPNESAALGESFIISDICYTCDRVRLCLPSSSPTFLMKDAALANERPLRQNGTDTR